MELQRQLLMSAPPLTCCILVGGAEAYETLAPFVVNRLPGSLRLIQ